MREAEIKLALTQHLRSSRGEEFVPRFIEELELNGGEIRADLVQVMDMHCYEIKSEADTLNRLVGQGSRYARVFDRVTLVTAAKHLKKAMPMLPPWWGVMVVPEEFGMSFKQVREAKPNKRHESQVLVTLLKRDEALKILSEQGITRGYKSKSLYLIQAKVAEILTLEQLKSCVRTCLLSRFDV